MNPAAVRVVFMGSPAFAVPSLRALAVTGYDIQGVVSQPDRPAGRGGRQRPPPVKLAAMELGLAVFQPESFKDPEAPHWVAAQAPDLLVVAAYGKILPRTVLGIPRRGSLNVHASLLPRWRGPSPIAAAILAGDDHTGVSIMEMTAKMDAGPSVCQAAVPIGPADTTGALEERLSELGARTLVDTLPGWYDGAMVATPQDESRATYCPLLTKADGALRVSLTAQQAERAVRAYDPWPGAWVGYRAGRLAVWAAHVAADGPHGAPGTLVIHNRAPAVTFADGLLVLDEVQKEGGRRLSGRDFLNGERGQLPAQVGLA